MRPCTGALQEVQRLKDQVQAENVYLRREVRERLGLTAVVGQSPAVRRVLEQIQQVAPTDQPCCCSEKPALARNCSRRRSTSSGPGMRGRWCGELRRDPGDAHRERIVRAREGAYTGALARQAGRFELANHSTIFLDEIGDLPSEVQVKLLRVLEERQIERLGARGRSRSSANHRRHASNLEQRIAEGAFREDLYYRLNVFPISVPPLRERVEDIRSWCGGSSRNPQGVRQAHRRD